MRHGRGGREKNVHSEQCFSTGKIAEVRNCERLMTRRHVLDSLLFTYQQQQQQREERRRRRRRRRERQPSGGGALARRPFLLFKFRTAFVPSRSQVSSAA